MDSPSDDLAPSVAEIIANTRESSLLAWGLVAVGVLLSIVAWMRPATLGGEPVGGAEGQQLVSFSYSASVQRTPAYQGTEVTAPKPVFRRLANTVEVGIDYEGTPGVVAVDAELSTDSGWRWTLPLAEAQEVPDGRYEGIVTLDRPILVSRYIYDALHVVVWPLRVLLRNAVTRSAHSDARLGAIKQPELPESGVCDRPSPTVSVLAVSVLVASIDVGLTALSITEPRRPQSG